MNKNTKRPPIFGILSLLFPLIGIPLSYMSTTPTQEGWGWNGAMHLVIKVLLAILCGVVCAFVGLARSEKWIVLSWLGLILNLSPIILMMAVG